MILSGRYGDVLWDPTGAGTPVSLTSVNAWTLSLATDRIEVTCFGDTNKVYIPGMKDVSGTIGGFWNSADTALVEAADQEAPGLLKLIPNNTEPTFFWSGLAYMDAEISCGVNEAPTLSGTWSAAGPWTREPASSALSASRLPAGVASGVVPPGYAPGRVPPGAVSPSGIVPPSQYIPGPPPGHPLYNRRSTDPHPGVTGR